MNINWCCSRLSLFVIYFYRLGAFLRHAVVKQRLQMYNSPYRSMTDCAMKIYRGEGLGAFYRSYGTQIVMNVPFQCVHFIVYEAMQNATNPNRNYNPMGHVVSGGVSGALAAAITTPLDVCKTLLNTQVTYKVFASFKIPYQRVLLFVVVFLAGLLGSGSS